MNVDSSIDLWNNFAESAGGFEVDTNDRLVIVRKLCVIPGPERPAPMRKTIK
jgi:hypothetical protein